MFDYPKLEEYDESPDYDEPRFEIRVQKNFKGQTPLHLAASNGHLKICKILFEKFLDEYYDFELEPKDDKLWTPLHYAAQNGDGLVFEYLMEKIRHLPKDSIDQAPLHVAAFNGNLDVCQLLIEKSFENW